MNIEPTQQPATDDPELAKVLEDGNDGNNGMQFEETPMNGDASQGKPDETTPADDSALNNAVDNLSQSLPAAPAAPTLDPPASPAAPSAPGDLESIKKDALSELRPLVEKLTLPADEKFDIMLLIIRSTDDQSLVGAAHEAAKGIEDETKRAQALLDIVKEIDYFAANQQQS